MMVVALIWAGARYKPCLSKLGRVHIADTLLYISEYAELVEASNFNWFKSAAIFLLARLC